MPRLRWPARKRSNFVEKPALAAAKVQSEVCYPRRLGNRRERQPGIYVEILIQASVEQIWCLTQDPALHQRWDLRFSRIHYLPRTLPTEPQRFSYETRIGFGLSIKGTGESVGQREIEGGESTSALKFASEDPKSLIREGSGYWRYVPVENGVRFLTWYDYQVRFGALGRVIDRSVFRPLMGWATTWSFDRLRLWAEGKQLPETAARLSGIHAICRITLAFIWIWHGLVPKVLFRHVDEQTMLRQAGVPLPLLPWIGMAEMALGILVLGAWNARALFLGIASLMVIATVVVVVFSSEFVRAAFNPVTLNVAMVALSVLGWIASPNLPSARRCLRKPPRLL